MSRRKKAIWTVALAALLLLLLAGGAYVLRGSPWVPAPLRVAPAAPPALSIFYTCDTRGHVEPCSCAEGVAGGMARRQAYLAANPAPARILVDAGNVTAGGRDWELLEAKYILRAYRLMGYDAVNAGAREASVDVDKLRALAGVSDRLVSANLLDTSGRPLFPPYRIATLDGGYRVAILGVVDDTVPAGELGAGLRIVPPEDALAKHLPAARQQADFVLLLAFADEQRMKALAERFYEIDAIVGGDVLQPSGTPERANRSAIVYITDKGKGVGRLDLVPASDGPRVLANDIRVLVDDVPAGPDLAALLEEYHAELARLAGDGKTPPLHDDEEGLTDITSSRSPNADTFAGATACRACHPQAYEVWAASGHARAFDTLARRDGQANPDCLPCHTTGHAASDGFVSAALTPALAAVSCEACHGRGAHHAQLESGATPPGPVLAFRSVDCTGCHDAANSPRFDPVAYWEKIAHGNG